MRFVSHRSEVKVTVDLDPDEQYERPKPYTESIRYRVETITIGWLAADGQVRLSATCVGPRLLKDGREGQSQAAVGWQDIPERLREPLDRYVRQALDKSAAVPLPVTDEVPA